MKLVVPPMNNNLQTRLQRVLASAQGLSEPRFDADMRIDNWPENFTVKSGSQPWTTREHDTE
jgi:hypothetical protein